MAAASNFVNHYAVLGVEPDATLYELNKAWKRFALKNHPDKSESSEATSIFQEGLRAIETLRNPTLRHQFDHELEKRKPRAAGKRSQSNRTTQYPHFTHAPRADADWRGCGPDPDHVAKVFEKVRQVEELRRKQKVEEVRYQEELKRHAEARRQQQEDVLRRAAHAMESDVPPTRPYSVGNNRFKAGQHGTPRSGEQSSRPGGTRTHSSASGFQNNHSKGKSNTFGAETNPRRGSPGTGRFAFPGAFFTSSAEHPNTDSKAEFSPIASERLMRDFPSWLGYRHRHASTPRGNIKLDANECQNPVQSSNTGNNTGAPQTDGLHTASTHDMPSPAAVDVTPADDVCSRAQLPIGTQWPPNFLVQFLKSKLTDSNGRYTEKDLGEELRGLVQDAFYSCSKATSLYPAIGQSRHKCAESRDACSQTLDKKYNQLECRNCHLWKPLFVYSCRSCNSVWCVRCQ